MSQSGTGHERANEVINAEVRKLADYVVGEYGVDRLDAYLTIEREANTQGQWYEDNSNKKNNER